MARACEEADAGPRCRAYLAELRSEFPRLRLVPKATDALSRVIDRALRIVTFGAQRAYLSAYVTTLGATIYLPDGFFARGDVEALIVLRHEAVHLRQFARLGFVPMAFVYLLPFFPLGLAYGRARLEWEAYAETLRATHELLGAEAAHDPSLEARIVAQFVSGAYGWMWPFPTAVRRWVRAELARLDGGARSGPAAPPGSPAAFSPTPEGR